MLAETPRETMTRARTRNHLELARPESPNNNPLNQKDLTRIGASLPLRRVLSEGNHRGDIQSIPGD
jgi:hypothetical protein